MTSTARRVRPGGITPIKRRDGSLTAAVSFRDAFGKRQKRFVYGRDALEVSRKHAEVSMLHGITPDNSMAFGAWLERFLRDHHQSQRLAHSTLVNYRTYLKRILPALGGVSLSELNPFVLRSFFDSLFDLSSSTRQHIHDLVNASLKDAVNLDVIEKNPMRAVKRPRADVRNDAKSWEPGEVTRLLRAYKGHRLEALPLVCFTLGLRIGEALALTWDDYKGETLDVNHTLNAYYKLGGEPFRPPKRGSYRTLTLPADLRETLEAHRSRQWAERGTFGTAWNPLNLIFCSGRGTPISVRNVRRLFDAMIAKAGVTRFGTHAMRKTYASLALSARVPIHDVQARLGHSDPRMTLKVYAKSLAATRKGSALSLAKLLEAGLTDGGEA